MRPPLPFLDSEICYLLSAQRVQAKLLKTYKRLTQAVEEFDDALLPADGADVEREEGVGRLREWNEAARMKWRLTTRVVAARHEHHRQFYVSAFFVGVMMCEGRG